MPRALCSRQTSSCWFTVSELRDGNRSTAYPLHGRGKSDTLRPVCLSRSVSSFLSLSCCRLLFWSSCRCFSFCCRRRCRHVTSPDWHLRHQRYQISPSSLFLVSSDSINSSQVQSWERAGSTAAMMMFAPAIGSAVRVECVSQVRLRPLCQQVLRSEGDRRRSFSSLARIQSQPESPASSSKSSRNWRENKSRSPVATQQYPKKTKREPWQVQKDALKEKFQDGWNPQKKLSPDAVDGIRQLHALKPDDFTTPVLADQFKISPEAVRRILKSRWRPSEAEMDDRRKRWEKRHDKIWSQMAELGLRPKRKRTQTVDDANVLDEDPDNA